MANTSFTTSTYEGQAALPFVAPAILSADTLSNGWISVLDNVRYKANLRKFSGVSVVDRTCLWNAGASPITGGSLDISDVQLVTTGLQVQEQICNEELAQTWAAEQMRGAYANAPADYISFLAQYVAKQVAKDIEGSIWQGNYSSDGGTTAAVYSSFDGILANIVAATPDRETVSTLPLAAGTVTTVSTGILDALAIITSGAEGAPDDIAGDADTKIFMSRKSAQLYYQALSAVYNLPFLNDGVATKYSGYDIIVPAGFPNDTILIGKYENFYFGTNLMTDMTSAKFMNLAEVTGDDVTRVAMMFDGGTQVVDHNSYAVWRYDAPE